MKFGEKLLSTSLRAGRSEGTATAVRFLARDARADRGLREVEISGSGILLRRTLSGIAMQIRVPLGAYRGVAVRAGEADALEVALVHADPDLDVVLFSSTCDGDIVHQWDAWGLRLGLPLLIVDVDGKTRTADQRLGALAIATTLPRRAYGMLRTRRPRFLRRRKMTRLPAAPVVLKGREIIARE